MELSKLSINLLAKEKLRRRFFDNCSAKSKASDELASSDNRLDGKLATSKDEKPDKVEQEANLIDVSQFDEETCPNEDNSLPLITSVFSLASNGRTDDKGSGSSDQIENVEGTSPSLSCPSSSQDAPRCNQGNLPFVVKCSPSGVITVCSTPNPISNSNFKENNKHSSITSNAKSSFCSTESPGVALARTDQQIREGVTGCSLPHSGTCLNPNVVTFIDATQQIVTPAEQPCLSERISESSTQRPTSGSLTDIPPILQQTEEVTVDSGSSSIPESNETEKDQDNGPHSSSSLYTSSNKAAIEEFNAEEVYIGQQVPTKQEERIRRLKDLLRQKEAELEKFRFKGKAGPVSAAAKLRANFLKKNPSLCRRSLRLSTKEGSESNGTVSREALGDKDTGLNTVDKNNLTRKKTITCESETNLMGEKISKKADSNNSNTSKKNCSKFNDQDRYKLVNVTVLQGHTRTLAVPLNEKALSPKTDKQNSFSLCSKENITTTRKRKQQMPRKVETRRSKRRSTSEEVRFDQARSSVNGKEGIHSLKPTLLKRKSPNEFGTRDGPSAPKKEQGKTFPALKLGTSVVSSTETPVGFLALPTTRGENQTQIGSLLTTTPAPTSSNLNGSGSSKNAKTVKSTTHVSSVYSPTTTTQDAITPNHDYTKQQTTSSTTGKNVAYVLHMNGSGQSSQKENNTASLAPDLLKRVAESISNEVNALVGQVPGDNTGCEGDFMADNVSGPSHAPLPDRNAQSNIGVITAQNTGEPTVISPKVASKMAVCPTSAKHLPDASGKGHASTLSIPLVNLEHSKIPNELAKLGLTCRSNVSSQPKSLPLNVSRVDVESANSTTTSKPIQPMSTSFQDKQVDQVIPNDTAINSRQSSLPFVKFTTTEQPKTAIQSTCVLNTDNLSKNAPPNLSVPNSQVATSVTVSVLATTLKNTVTQSLTSDSFKPKASVVINNQISTGVTAANVPADNNSGIGNSMKSLLTTVSRISTTVKNEETAVKTNPCVPNSLYTLNALTFPVAIAGEPKAKNVYAAPIKDSSNLASRPLVPKHTPPQFTSHRPIAPKPIPIHQSPPTKVMLKHAAPLLCNAVTPVSTSSEHTSEKSKSAQGISPKPDTAKSTLSQGTATNSTSSEQNISILPKPIKAVPTSSSPAFPENIKNGKILVYDVVQSNIAQRGGNPAIINKDGAKLVVYVSNTGEKRNLGIIKDQKIYLNSNQVAAVANQPKVQSPVTTPSAEFIPNAEDADFSVLLGLEHVVKLLL